MVTFFVSPADLGKGKWILETEKKLSKKGFGISRKFPENSILFTCIGSTIGKSGMAPKELTSNQQINSVLPNSRFSSDYLFYTLNLLSPRIKSLAGEQAVPIINKSEFGETPVPLPSTKAEQTAIATALSDADALIQSLERLIAKKRNIKQGAMQELLKLKEGWVVKKLGEVGEIITGSTPPTEVKGYWNGDIPWITPTDISLKKDIFHSEREITSLGLKVVRKLPANTLLVTCIASIGKNAIFRKAGSCNQQINAIVPNSNNNIEFLYYLIENSKQYLLSKAGITATNIISKKDFTEITFSVPLLEEQTHIAAILSDMDAEIAALETKLVKYRQIKQGMMQNLLTGRIRLV
ncbi:MAG: restriction endonuclease subunit S [Deltaproteobacteria bacterium]|nr:restriction endonuclease subunit S [Deltaproteobacteria bacterium]